MIHHGTEFLSFGFWTVPCLNFHAIFYYQQFNLKGIFFILILKDPGLLNIFIHFDVSDFSNSALLRNLIENNWASLVHYCHRIPQGTDWLRQQISKSKFFSASPVHLSSVDDTLLLLSALWPNSNQLILLAEGDEQRTFSILNHRTIGQWAGMRILDFVDNFVSLNSLAVEF